VAFVGISDGLGTFEALVNILGDGKATSARLADLKAATEAARQAKADAVAKQQKAEAALENLAAEERRSEASSREQDKKLAARLVEVEAREERVKKTEAEGASASRAGKADQIRRGGSLAEVQRLMPTGVVRNFRGDFFPI
jgi:hypothetical protein